jgi:hypothetical protein
MSEGSSGGRIVAGIFILLCGLCLALVGGGCTIFILGQRTYGDTGLFLLIALAALALGLWLLWIGFRLLSGREGKP